MPRVLLYDSETIDRASRREKRQAQASRLPIINRNGRFYKVDGRSKSGRLLRDTRDALLEQLNRKPTSAEKLLIEKLAWLHLCTQFLDSKILAGSVEFGEALQYSSHIEAFQRGLTSLGLLGRVIELPTFDAQTLDEKTQAAGASGASVARARVADAE